MPNHNEELAIIRNINCGVRDTNKPICWFEVETISGSALQIVSLSQMGSMIDQAQAYSLQDLNGRGCIVIRDNNTVVFKALIN